MDICNDIFAVQVAILAAIIGLGTAWYAIFKTISVNKTRIARLEDRVTYLESGKLQ